MKITRFIYLILLFLGWSGHLVARDPQIIGVMNSPSGKVACFELEAGERVQSVSIVRFDMKNGEKTMLETTGFHNGHYFFANIPANGTENSYAYQFVLGLSDGTEYQSSKYEETLNRWFDWLGSDVEWTEATSGVAGRPPMIDTWYSPFPGFESYVGFKQGYVFKALVTCADGYFLYDFPENTPYDLLKTEYGVAYMDPETFSADGDVHFVLSVNDIVKAEYDMFAPGIDGLKPPFARDFETPISGATKVKLAGTSYDNNTDGDIMVFALPRVYLKEADRQAQTIDWITEKHFDENRPFDYELTAKASSGLPISYRVVHGTEYASVDGSKMHVNQIPKDDYIELEAFQAGNEQYKPSDLYRCRITVSGKKIVDKQEAYVLHEHEKIGEIIVKGDRESVGQISVEKGSANIGKLVLQYTFVPGEWNFISFPANADLSKITDLESLGYSYNTGNKAFYVLEYDTKKRADNPSETAWTRLSKPTVLANKGYIMGVSRSDDNPNNDPVTVNFTFDNLTLDLNKEQNGTIGVDMDFYEVDPDSEIPVYIKPADGVKGNILKFNLKFEPKNREDLAMNYQYELEQSRITFNPNRSGIRITLPTSETAKVLIFDKKERLVKAVRYESPFLIDIQDLKKGEYQVLIQYGNAQEYKKLVIE